MLAGLLAVPLWAIAPPPERGPAPLHDHTEGFRLHGLSLLAGQPDWRWRGLTLWDGLGEATLTPSTSWSALTPECTGAPAGRGGCSDTALAGAMLTWVPSPLSPVGLFVGLSAVSATTGEARRQLGMLGSAGLTFRPGMLLQRR